MNKNFSDETPDIILDRMLKTIDDSIDKRQNSIVHVSLSPSSQEFYRVRQLLDIILMSAFPQTSKGKYLDYIGSSCGLKRHPSTSAIRRGIFNVSVPKGKRFFLEETNQFFVSLEEGTSVKMMCETSGIIGNQGSGQLVPESDIDGLTSSKLTDIILNGIEEESDESFKSRILDCRFNPVTSGNKHHYKKWAMEVSGVGGCIVEPLWNGNGTVKLIIVDSEFKNANSELIKKVFEHIEKVRPIGAKISIESAKSKEINISSNVIISHDRTSIDTVIKSFEKELKIYLTKLTFNLNYISSTKIGKILLEIPGVLDYSELKVNGKTNLKLKKEEFVCVNKIDLREQDEPSFE